jgi:hypothetical protein
VGDRGVIDVDGVVLAKSQKAEPAKVVPRSVMILLGTLNRCDMSPMIFAASSDVTFAIGQTSINLVNLSTANSMCL